MPKAHWHAIRRELIKSSLEWAAAFGLTPAIIGELGEVDAAYLLSKSPKMAKNILLARTPRQKGYDLLIDHQRIQVKATRSSGLPGSTITRIQKPRNDMWDLIVWINYNRDFHLQEAWLWTRRAYLKKFSQSHRISPEEFRKGKRLK